MGRRCGAGGGGGDSRVGRQLGDRGDRGRTVEGGQLGDPTGGAGRSVPPTPDAQPALFAPTYPREHPAGYIPTPCTTPTPVSRECSFTTTHKYTKTLKRTYVHTRLNNYTDARCPHSGRAVRLNARSEQRKVGEGSGVRFLLLGSSRTHV